MEPDSPLFTFVHVTDTHYHAGDAMLEAFVEAINAERFFPLPDHIIHTGDIITGYNDTLDQHVAQMRAAKAILDRLRAPAVFTCHNHDTYGEHVRGAVFDEVFGSPHVQEIARDGFYLLVLSGALESSPVFGQAHEDGPPPWGFDPHTAQGLALLRSRLAAHEGAHKLVFSHLGLLSPRKVALPEDPSRPIPQRSGFGYSLAEPKAAPMRRVFERYGVVAHYSGHCHVNMRRERNGVSYVATASLVQYPGEARRVSVYPDRLVHRMMSLPGGRGLPRRWPNVMDADHRSNDLYLLGHAHEREFAILLPPRDGAGRRS